MAHWDEDTPGVALPHPEFHLVVRFGPSARHGLDAHVFGARQHVHRKLLRGGQQSVSARLHLGTTQALFGVTAGAVAGHIVSLDELWDAGTTRHLYARLAEARDTVAAATILDSVLAERLARAESHDAHVRLAARAAEKLASTSVSSAALELGVSERHLRRVFREMVGVSPKEFAKLTRFHRALATARAGAETNWATIAAAAGYYDQAHLIAEFRAITGVTPRALLAELRMTASVV